MVLEATAVAEMVFSPQAPLFTRNTMSVYDRDIIDVLSKLQTLLASIADSEKANSIRKTSISTQAAELG